MIGKGSCLQVDNLYFQTKFTLLYIIPWLRHPTGTQHSVLRGKTEKGKWTLRLLHEDNLVSEEICKNALTVSVTSTQVQEESNMLKFTRTRNNLRLQAFFNREKFCACSWDMKEPWIGRLAPLLRLLSRGWYRFLFRWGCAAGIPEPLSYSRPSSTQLSYPILD